MDPQHWIEACRPEELPPGSRKLVKVNNLEVALFNLEGVIYAIKNRCPHRSGSVPPGLPSIKLKWRMGCSTFACSSLPF